MKSLQYTIN